ncbi:MAG: hypothetical protein AAGD13_02280 [Pseudomonadota bacterium]
MSDKSKPEEISEADLDVAGGALAPDMKIRGAATSAKLDMERVMGVRIDGNPIGGVRKMGVRQEGIRIDDVRKKG